jgi:hypothetical protein
MLHDEVFLLEVCRVLYEEILNKVSVQFHEIAYKRGARAGVSTFTAAIGSNSWEYFDLRFAKFVPSEMKSEVEFLGSSDLGSWASLIWTINSHFSVAGVTATAQLYNWNSGGYPTGAGDGYMTTTIGTSDMTMTQTINTNPTYFKDASGNWKMKFTGVLATKAYFNWFADVVWLKPAH